MPYTVVAGAILEVGIAGRMHGQRTLSLFHYKLEHQGAPLDGQLLITNANAALNQNAGNTLVRNYAAAINEQMTLEEVVYQWIYPTRFARIVKTPAQLSGSILGAAMPANTAIAISKRTDLAGRRGHGTLHMPGISREQVTESSVTPLGTEQYGPLMQRMMDVVNIEFGTNLLPVVFNRASPALSPQITSVQARTTIRTQYRRTVGVGE